MMAAGKVGGMLDLFGREAGEVLGTAGGQVVRDRVLDHLEQLLRGVAGPDAQLVQQLDHEAAEAVEGARDPRLRVDLDQHLWHKSTVENK